MNQKSDIAAIILAGGKGVRMNSELPKVLHLLNDKPLIEHVIDSMRIIDINNIVIVVGYKGELVIEALGKDNRYAWQYEQLGTGHAVMQAEEELKDFSGHVVVACGDVPLIKPETFNSLIDEIKKAEVKAVVLTMKLENPHGYGRILKDDNGSFLRIVEEKDASDKEKEIKEVNSGTYIFDKEFLFNGLKEIDTDNAQGEYYLPDALNYIIKKNFSVNTVILKDPVEGSGINSQEELKRLEDSLKVRSN